MDDQAALIARRVALSAATWFNAPADVEAYRRLAAAVGEWNAYVSPQLEGRRCRRTARRLGRRRATDAVG